MASDLSIFAVAGMRYCSLPDGIRRPRGDSQDILKISRRAKQVPALQLLRQPVYKAVEAQLPPHGHSGLLQLNTSADAHNKILRKLPHFQATEDPALQCM